MLPAGKPAGHMTAATVTVLFPDLTWSHGVPLGILPLFCLDASKLRILEAWELLPAWLLH